MAKPLLLTCRKIHRQEGLQLKRGGASLVFMNDKKRDVEVSEKRSRRNLTSEGLTEAVDPGDRNKL